MYLITIIDKLREAEYPIDNVITYNENNDPNKLLGRPGQYIEKVNFADLRLYQSDENNPAGGSIEIFENEKDCQNRVDYLKKSVRSRLLLSIIVWMIISYYVLSRKSL